MAGRKARKEKVVAEEKKCPVTGEVKTRVGRDVVGFSNDRENFSLFFPKMTEIVQISGLSD